MSEGLTTLAVVLTVAAMTAFVRGIPYLLFGGKRELPETVSYLGNVLPPAIMIILVVYCLRNIDIAAFPYGLAELISVALTALLQFRKKNTILSILAGTACYMILIRTVFPV